MAQMSEMLHYTGDGVFRVSGRIINHKVLSVLCRYIFYGKYPILRHPQCFFITVIPMLKLINGVTH